MALKAKANAFEPRELIPARRYRAVCIGVCDLGTQGSNFGDKHKVQLVWELHTKKGPAVDSKGNAHTITEACNLSFGENSAGQKARLRVIVEAMTGQAFSQEQAQEGYDIEELVGMSCEMTVVHTPDKLDSKKVWANIGSLIALDEDEAPVEPTLTTFYYEIDPDKPIPSDVPKWLHPKIAKAKEWIAVHGEPEEDESKGKSKPRSAAQTAGSRARTQATTDEGDGDEEDDDIPF